MATLRATYTGTDAKDKAISIVDKAAEKVRQSLDTPIYGQESLYLQKRIEAERYLNGSTGPTPFLEADLPGTYKVVVNPADAKYYTAEFEVDL